MIIWMLVSEDEYELPLKIADSRNELARLCGVTPNDISSAISHAKARGTRSRYVKVEVNDESHWEDQGHTT